MEKLMQYVWQYRLFPQVGLTTVDGRRVSIINPGLLNTGPGPDFFNASVEIDGQRWVGNVEIHVRASDWHRHGHDSDPAYHSVILHVVDADDVPIRRPDGSIIPQMRMPCSAQFSNYCNRLMEAAPTGLPCSAAIASLPAIYITDWISALGYERVHEKAERIDRQLEALAGDWEETAYITLARALGFGINAEPFERLARSLPLRFVRKHADSVLSVESLLFGQAGMLPQKPSADAYIARLQTEYSFLANKFGLRAPQSLGWKNSGIRPANFPHRRIALLANMIVSRTSLMSAIASIESLDEARQLFDAELTGYWAHHYTLGGAASESKIYSSKGSVNLLIINVVVPLLYAYSLSRGDYDRAESAIELLHELPAEHNRLVDIFPTAGIPLRDAFTSQALLQLRRAYCQQRKCIYCRIGYRHLSTLTLRRQ